MTIKTGDKLPAGTFKFMSAEGPKEISTDELFTGKHVVLFSVPGAFTPTCSKEHLPSYVKNYDKIKAQGVDTIACLSVNDKGLGVRGKRFSMIVKNGVVEKLNIDEGKYEMSGAEATCSLN